MAASLQIQPLCAKPAIKNLPYKLLLTNDPAERKPTQIFSCYSDKVYAYLRLPQKTKGKHVLDGYWYKPDGKLQEHAEIPLEFKSAGEDLAHLWLKFHVERPSPSDLLFPNLELQAFEGDWKVEVLWDQKNVATSTFTVRCV